MRQASEHEIQAAIVDALRLAGFSVRETTAYKQRGSSGIDKGIPDLLIAHPLAPQIYLGIEVKRPGEIKWSSTEQHQAFLASEFWIATSPEEGIRQVLDFVDERIPHGPLHSNLRTKLLSVLRGMQ